MAMSKFKAGDKVKCVRGFGRSLTVDNEYVVNTTMEDQVELKGVGGGYWHESRFELVDDTPAAPPRILPDDASRESYPLYDGLFAYFPAALCEVARWSKIGNDKHNPGEPMHWAREKSTDHENKILRHLMDARQVDANGVVEAVALAWRSLALCQTILEERGWAEGANSRRTPHVATGVSQ